MPSVNQPEGVRVATVGSPSSNYEVTLDVAGDARAIPLVGSVVSLENPMGDGSELALGTVTEVVTTNKWHEDPAFRGLLRSAGDIPGMSGDDGDIRKAMIRIQAAWKRENREAKWVASGPNLRMSPATGTAVKQINGGLVAELIDGAENIAYMGHLAGTEGIPLPLNLPDFSSNLAAFHSAVYGLTGSGKSLYVSTPVPTPTGWTTMGELVDGDIIFDEEGKPCRVIKAHEIRNDRPCYQLTFSDGSTIVADAEHLWLTVDAAARQSDSVQRGKERVRRNRLSDQQIRKMRTVADSLHPLATLSAKDIQREFGISSSSHLIEEAAAIVGIAGTEHRPFTYFRPPMVKTRKWNLLVYPRKDVMEALAESFEVKPVKNWTNASLSSRTFAMDVSAPEKVTLREIAEVVGVSNRSSELMRRIKATGVSYTKEKLPTIVIEKGGERTGSTVEITVYPAASILRTIADLGSGLLHDQRETRCEQRVVTTEQIRNTLYDNRNSKEQRLNHAVPVAKALELPDIELPVGPYSLGAFLGDGDSRTGEMSGIDKEIITIMEGEGYPVYAERTDKRKEHTEFRQWKLSGLREALRDAGLLQKTTAEGSQKHIPAMYLRASISQRRALLAGLLDTDGTVGAQGDVSFCNTNERLAREVHELALSLGYRATLTSSIKRSQHGTECLAYLVSWTCKESPFGISRKTKTHSARSGSYSEPRNSYRYITSVEPVDSVPVRCITVDSPNHLYLVGETMIPTHNTQATAIMLAAQMRFQEHGMVIVDPQGQWASEQGMVFSLQGFADELGRDVMVHRISTDLRLAKDAPLMTNLLKHTRLVVELGLKHENTEEIVWYEMTKALRDREDWTTDSSEVLLKALLEHLASDGPASRVYTTPENATRFQQRVNDVINSVSLFSDALNQFAPIHNLFQATNPSGSPRHDLNRTLSSVFDRNPGRPAPLLILDMSSIPIPGMDQEVEESAERAYEILEKDAVKAAILRNLFHTLKRASETRFRTGDNLNTLIVLDEAWRYAAPPGKVEEEELQLLSKDLAGYARDTRKFGIGWLYISQSTRSVNLDIWDQLTVRLFGYGLNGADLDKVGEVVDDKAALRLYRGSGNPSATGVYPFMMTGPVSPLAANATPVMLHVYTDFQAFREDNDHWIRPIRQALGVPVLSGQPAALRGNARPGRLKSRGAVKDVRKAIIETSKAARENRAATGMMDPEGFGSSLDNLDAEDTSF